MKNWLRYLLSRRYLHVRIIVIGEAEAELPDNRIPKADLGNGQGLRGWRAAGRMRQ